MLSWPENLQPIDSECSLDPSEIETVSAKNFQIAELVAQAQFVVGLQLVTVARFADALKVFPAVWIAGIKSPYEPCRHDVVYVALDSSLLEIHSAGLHFTLPPQSWRPPTPPSLS